MRRILKLLLRTALNILVDTKQLKLPTYRLEEVDSEDPPDLTLCSIDPIPTKDKDLARTAYKQAWSRYLFSIREEEKLNLGSFMDGLQHLCADSPEEWQEFAGSLPGLGEFWARVNGK